MVEDSVDTSSDLDFVDFRRFALPRRAERVVFVLSVSPPIVKLFEVCVSISVAAASVLFKVTPFGIWTLNSRLSSGISQSCPVKRT